MWKGTELSWGYRLSKAAFTGNTRRSGLTARYGLDKQRTTTSNTKSGRHVHVLDERKTNFVSKLIRRNDLPMCYLTHWVVTSTCIRELRVPDNHHTEIGTLRVNQPSVQVSRKPDFHITIVPQCLLKREGRTIRISLNLIISSKSSSN